MKNQLLRFAGCLVGALTTRTCAVLTAAPALLLVLLMPWLGHLPPWSWVSRAAHNHGADPCAALASCVAAVAAYLLPHQLVFRYNPLLRQHVAWVGLLAGEALGFAVCAIVWLAYGFQGAEGVSDLILAAASLTLSLVVSLLITLQASRVVSHIGWRSAVADAFALLMVGWAVAVSATPHFAGHQGFGVAVLAGASSLATAHYVTALVFEGIQERPQKAAPE